MRRLAPVSTAFALACTVFANTVFACLVFACLVFAFLAPSPLSASDHADPIFNSHPDAGLTGLFVFPHQGELIVILGIHPSLSTPGPYDLHDFRYHVHIDHHTEVTFENSQDLARYGGTIPHPAGISADVTLSFELDDEAGLVAATADGMDVEQLEIVTGVYDDPFIFPRFFGKNIVAVVVRIPYAELPSGRRDFLFWGTTTEGDDLDEQIDHVGRSNRTQLPRFDFLNDVPPKRHVEEIEKTDRRRQRARNFLRRFPPPALYQAFDLLQSIRHYDFVPDVMIFSFRNPPGYPNGRRLEDDIVAISCAVGDCLLRETSFQESEAWPRLTTNDKPFAAEFPFLAAPWPEKPPESTPGCLVPVLIFLALLVLVVWLVRKLIRKLRSRGDGQDDP